MGAVTYALVVGCALVFFSNTGAALSWEVAVGLVGAVAATLWCLTQAATLDPGIVRATDADVQAGVSTRELAPESFLPPSADAEAAASSSHHTDGGAVARAATSTARALASAGMGVAGSRRVVRLVHGGGVASARDGTLCVPCGLVIPDAAAAVHCDACGVCVRGHDHHCPWVGTCIGAGNLAYFWGFLVTLAFTITGMAIAAITSAAASAAGSSRSFPQPPQPLAPVAVVEPLPSPAVVA